MSDTIVALSTPSGVAALAVIRLSGPESHAIIARLVTTKVDATPGHAHYRTLAHEGKTLDDVVLTFWRAPHSFTGEDTVEISCHGNPRIVGAIIRTALELGARAARPGGRRRPPWGRPRPSRRPRSRYAGTIPAG